MASSTAPVASAPKPTITLKRGVVGLVGAATLGAIMMSPALGLYGNWGPLAQDVVITGHDRNELGVLIFPDLKGCQSLCAEEAGPLDVETLVEHPNVRLSLVEKLRDYNSRFPRSSTAISRALFLTKPANGDALEINDKGYLNQRAVLEHRAELVIKLYAADPDDDVIVVGQEDDSNR